MAGIEWIDEKKYEPDLLHLFRIDLAPDYLHKANISGGGPFAPSPLANGLAKQAPIFSVRR